MGLYHVSGGSHIHSLGIIPCAMGPLDGEIHVGRALQEWIFFFSYYYYLHCQYRKSESRVVLAVVGK